MKKFSFLCVIIFCVLSLVFITGCKTNNNQENNGNENENENNNGELPTSLLQPQDLVYQGAFRLPDGTSDVKSWLWGGQAMTYYPGGDPNGPDDGYPGSIFAAGHGWEHQVSEISIPVPKNITTATTADQSMANVQGLGDLNTAGTLQGFHDIFHVSDLEIPRTGLEYLPKQGSQTSAKLYFCYGYHMQDGPADLTHGWCDLNLAKPNIKGSWYLEGLSACVQNMSTNDYLFEIPGNWSDAYVPGKRLATGRYRDGGWSGQGPSIFAIGPWNQGNPPAAGTALENTPLLLYTSTCDYDAEEHTMNNYHHADEWSGAAWLTAGDKAAVVFAGTKGTGDCWYGFADGTLWPNDDDYIPPPPNDDRGWWSTGFEGQFLFYDPADLAGVAQGTKKPYEPQPYAVMKIDQYLYHVTSKQQKYHLGAICFDRSHGLLYVFEFLADGDKPLVHVWKASNQ